MAHRTVLVVDDEAPVLRCVRRELTFAGHKVLSAASAEEALELLAGQRVDVLLTDYCMPSMLGTELIARAAQRQPWLRKILMTGCPEEARAKTPHDVHILPKPWPVDALARLVSDAHGPDDSERAAEPHTPARLVPSAA